MYTNLLNTCFQFLRISVGVDLKILKGTTGLCMKKRLLGNEGREGGQGGGYCKGLGEQSWWPGLGV